MVAYYFVGFKLLERFCGFSVMFSKMSYSKGRRVDPALCVGVRLRNSNAPYHGMIPK